MDHEIDPLQGARQPVLVAHIADEEAHPLVAAVQLAISHCFISSREKITSRRGLYFASVIGTKLLPKDPVPPVSSIEELVSIGGSHAAAFERLYRYLTQGSKAQHEPQERSANRYRRALRAVLDIGGTARSMKW